LDSGSIAAREKSWTRGARALDHLGDAFGQSHRSARVCFEHQLQCSALSVEGGQELGAPVGRGQHPMHESLERRMVVDGRIRHARFDIPAGAVLITQPRARRTRFVLDTRHAQCDVA